MTLAEKIKLIDLVNPMGDSPGIVYSRPRDF